MTKTMNMRELHKNLVSDFRKETHNGRYSDLTSKELTELASLSKAESGILLWIASHQNANDDSYYAVLDGKFDYDASLIIMEKASADMLDHVYETMPANIRCFIAKNPNATTSMLDRLWVNAKNNRISDSTYLTGSMNWVMIHPNCPAEIIEEGCRSNDARWNVAAASNPSCPPQWLSHFSSSDTTDIAQAALSNPSCPAEDIIRHAMSDNDDYSMPWAIAENPSAPAYILEHLFAHNNRSFIILYSLGKNPNTPQWIKDFCEISIN